MSLEVLRDVTTQGSCFLMEKVDGPEQALLLLEGCAKSSLPQFPSGPLQSVTLPGFFCVFFWLQWFFTALCGLFLVAESRG